ncbi:DUF6113 family protein [Streptomyces sp. NPDC048506]|uniref:DUF6113 family protein n=1 Tax=Streptomyces sp. NPDC048506 TaxID=3155028 RepID=UPI003444FE26
MSAAKSGDGGATPGKGNGRPAADKANGSPVAGRGQRSRAGSGGTPGARDRVRPGAPVPPAPGSGLSAPLTPGRIATYVLLLIAGVLVAFGGTLVQAAWFPGGLVLALGGVAGLFYGGARATGTTAGALVPGASWLVTVFLLLSDVRPEGDFLFGPGVGSYLFLLGGILVAVICATAAQVRTAGARYGRVGG